MEIEFEVEKGLVYKLQFFTRHPLRWYGGIGKSYPRTTQCLLFKNNFLVNMGEVVKHTLDEDNPKFAMRLAAKKAIDGNINLKWIRKKLWKEIIDKTK